MATPGAATRIPRPNGTTFKIVAAALAVSAVAYMFVIRKNSTELADIESRTARTEQQLQRESTLLRAYEKGDILVGPALADATGYVESLLPATGKGAGDVYSTIEGIARARGLQVTDFELPSEYTDVVGAEASGFPQLKVAQGSMRITGSVTAMVAFLTELEQFPQLVTYTSSGITGTPETSTMQLELGLWTSVHPEWRGGVPADDPSRKPDAPASKGGGSKGGDSGG